MTPEKHSEMKNQIFAEGVKGLYLVNGGAIIALVTWLQNVWDKPWAKEMLEPHLYGLAAFACGVILAAFVPFFRYMAFLSKNTLVPIKNFWWWAHMVFITCSLISPGVGAWYIVCGALNALP